MRDLKTLKELIKAETTRAYNLKTKQAKAKAWAKVRALRDEACEILYSIPREGTQSVKAIVKTFRPGDNHFLVETVFGHMWVSPTADVLTKSWCSHTCCIEYTIGQEIVLEFDVEVNTDKLFREIIPGHISGGRVNETQYAELCKRDDLAFFKYPNSNGVTGLFSTKSKAV